ncbi:MAG TPA: hypothetical protein VGC93_15830 [Thermoanaerobaculia bacterium]
MRITKLTIHTILAVAVSLAVSSSAQAQASRTWVSGVGNDANPCSRTAPCKTFAGAISKTAAHGEINVLDPGGFGAVTITKSITILGDGDVAGILASLVNGVIVNAGVNDVITLKGLDIEGFNNGLNGIRFLAGGSLHVQDCVIRNFAQHGIDFEPSGNSKLFVDDTLITDNGAGSVGGGILIKPTATGTAKAQIHNTRLQGNRFGLTVEARGNATVTQGVASGNTLHGYSAFSNTGTTAVLALDDSPTTHNGTNGVIADGIGSIVRISNMLIFDNATGVNNNGGSMVSWQNNRILGNTTQIAGTLTPQGEQ